MNTIPEYDAWLADPTPENMSKVVTALDPVLVTEAQRYPGPKDLLHTKAKSLAIKAVRTYNPQKGAALRSWVVTQLQPLSRYGQRLRPVQVPEAVIRQSAELNATTERLHDQLSRMPTNEELADELGISVDRVTKLQRRNKPTVSESQVTMVGDSEEGAPDLPAVIAPKTVEYAAEAIYQDLDPRDRLIFDWKTGMHGREQLANQEIAARLGVTPALISQTSARIAKAIQEANSRVVS